MAKDGVERGYEGQVLLLCVRCVGCVYEEVLGEGVCEVGVEGEDVG